MLYLIVYDRRDNSLIVRRIHHNVKTGGFLVEYIELIILLNCLNKKTRTNILADLKVSDKAVCWITEREIRVLETIDYFSK
jgi:hypothetical protein